MWFSIKVWKPSYLTQQACFVECDQLNIKYSTSYRPRATTEETSPDTPSHCTDTRHDTQSHYTDTGPTGRVKTKIHPPKEINKIYT